MGRKVRKLSGQSSSCEMKLEGERSPAGKSVSFSVYKSQTDVADRKLEEDR